MKHVPVLLEEVLTNLHIGNRSGHLKNQGRYVDATLGAGGYTKAICEAGGEVLGIDADDSMLVIAKENLKETLRLRSGRPLVLVQGNFKDIGQIAEENGFNEVDGIVYDLGVSNVHFTDEERGFSFKNENAKLDMRLDTKFQSLKASDLLNALRVEQLRQIFEEVIGRNEAFNLAKRIVARRDIKKFETVGDLLNILDAKRPGKIHPATKIFMALRIAVNSELDNLRDSLPQALDLIKAGGRIAVVSFHSLEDRIVKDQFNEWEDGRYGRVVTGKPISPKEEEILVNPKSRSAKMRVFEKL